ncbi:cytochrome c [Deinococcus sp. 6YEL10]|uniref:c-type cytochrome n=1 Tax=Deinococcus sp. 6YEL10 TaxID=2745870 RepID=UPI001E640B7C|nr:c-type cytochrome [Deinococcus sp. 6YEL10]MCD0163097.1 cytochrome c [Deinococcus sp. 6YEL10]
MQIRRGRLSRFLLPGLLALGAPLVLAQTATSPATTDSALAGLAPSAARGETLSGSCAGCHAPTGRAPVLKGDPAPQIRTALLAFRAKTRPNGTMQNVASRLSDQDIVDIAAFYSGDSSAPAAAPATPPVTPAPVTPPPATTPPVTPPPTTTGTPATGTTATGETLYQVGAAARGVIACAVCHGETGAGAEDVGVPAITGRTAASVLAQLRAYKSGPVTGIPYPDAMHIALTPMTDADLNAVATYVATLK